MGVIKKLLCLILGHDRQPYDFQQCKRCGKWGGKL